MKKLICWLLGHKYKYNFGWMPSRCVCKRCGMKWKAIKNPDYIPGQSHPYVTEINIWVKDNEEVTKE